jgi:hypothetical protein
MHRIEKNAVLFSFLKVSFLEMEEEKPNWSKGFSSLNCIPPDIKLLTSISLGLENTLQMKITKAELPLSFYTCGKP